MKKKIKLTESRIHQVIAETIQQAIKGKINEGSTDQELYNRFCNMQEQLGSDTIVSEIWNYLSSNELAEFVDWMERSYDLVEY